MLNNAADIIFFIGAGFSKIQATLPLKRIWASQWNNYFILRDKLAVEEKTE